MNLAEIKELFLLFNDSNVREFDLKQVDFSLYLSKNEQNRVALNSSPIQQESVGATELPSSQSTTSSVQELESTNKSTEDVVTIQSPLVGVAYLKPSPDKAPFKQVGDKVKKGDIVCIIEAMKVMNEITSDVDGEIVEINVSNEEMVEYNQVLFTVKEG
ncbi:acetyl-CoA carboxylase biotin carboxyl carrier protein [Enterococcus cecorum]|uniref:acetyl-CoA carboxylase biotin carboxyl carrier protein n=1 Tax=Enterococcus cecorum TaxID=44008 RepID=UPI002ACA26C8|nr:acetyl-CoA carboxylase biotin carboxyl carrier protein [Enterococcus cecorum]MDZ5578964.1 acetyl-CoA carboxylase biotin carboxyl carrier protein [Enterococcus cecorum]